MHTADSLCGSVETDMLETTMCVCGGFRRVQLFVTLWTVARQALQSGEFSRLGYWSGLPFLTPGEATILQ